MANQTNQNKPFKEAKEGFIKLPREKWKYEIESGEITWEEHSIREWLWLKANPMTGKVAVNYIILAEETKGRFPYIKDTVNKITKIMLSLKAKQRLWFPEHSGSRNVVEVELAEYPLIQGGYTDIPYRFQQSSIRTNEESTTQNPKTPAELSGDGQRPKELKSGINELKSVMSMNPPGRAPEIDRKIIDRNIDYNNYNSSKIKGYEEANGSEAYRKRFGVEPPWTGNDKL